MDARYAVTSQRETTAISDDGTLVPVMEIRFRSLSSSVTGSVQVPIHLYTAETVREKILDYLERIDAVAQLAD